MLQISAERLIPPPLVFSANVTGDPEPPDGATGDPEVPGGGIKPPTGSQPATPEREGGIKPPTATDEPESNPQDPGDDIIIKGG
jgi:hypothetical protein